MNFIERQLPLLSWIMKARQARFFAKGFFAVLSQTRKNRLIARELNLQVATDAENQWYTGVRKVSKSKDLFDLYQAYVNNAHSGEKVVYQSPLLGES